MNKLRMYELNSNESTATFRMLWLAETDRDCHRFSYAAAAVVVMDHTLATTSYYIVKIDRNPSS